MPEIKIDSVRELVTNDYYKPLCYILKLNGNLVHPYYSGFDGKIRPVVPDPSFAVPPVAAPTNNFVYNQSSPSAHWHIPYDPAWGIPSVDVYDSTNRQVFPYIEIESPGVIGVVSSGGFSGYAKLNF